MHTLQVPAQEVVLRPTKHDGRWTGFIQVGDQTLRFEALALDSAHPVTEMLISGLEDLAACGAPLQQIDLDGRGAFLCAMPAPR